MFQQITRCQIARIIIGQRSVTKWPWSCMPVKNCCVITKYNGRNAWTRVAKWKAWTRGFLRQGGFTLSDTHRQLSAVCAEKALAGSTMFCFPAVASELNKKTVHEWCGNTPRQWFREAIRKLGRGWQRFITEEGIC